MDDVITGCGDILENRFTKIGHWCETEFLAFEKVDYPSSHIGYVVNEG